MTMGDIGAAHIVEKHISLNSKKSRGLNVLTICNTGSLATCGYGTALGVIRSLHKLNALEKVYCLETRPYNQGGRLTAYELLHDHIPCCLIADSMVSFLASKTSIDVILVGGDRVAMNGDTINKIGTLQLAIVARHFGIPVYTVVPTSTLDPGRAHGRDVVIEERSASEILTMNGQFIAPPAMPVWNPSFDVTPSHLLAGVITELGVAVHSDSSDGAGFIDIPAFLSLHAAASGASIALGTATGQGTVTVTPASNSQIGYRIFDSQSLLSYVLDNIKLCGILGVTNESDGSQNFDSLEVREIGDGNLNLVFIVTNTRSGKALIVKQALPYVRCVGEGWPLSLTRIEFECNSLRLFRELNGGRFVPEIYHFDGRMYLLAMQYIPPPNVVVRHLLQQGVRLRTFVDAITTFVVNISYKTSSFSLSHEHLSRNVEYWSRNVELCKLTLQVIFTEPLISCANNHFTPQISSYVAQIQGSAELKRQVVQLKEIFMTQKDSLCHGDLHSGSIMGHEEEIFVIDSEFAFYGPFGFDVGMLLANLVMSYFSNQKHSSAESDSYAEWMLHSIEQLLSEYHRKFREQFRTSVAALSQGGEGERGELMSAAFPGDDEAFALSVVDGLLSRTWLNLLGFAGVEVIRRIVGIAHVADLESIVGEAVRAECERKCLLVGVRLLALSSGRARLGDTWKPEIGELCTYLQSVYKNVAPEDLTIKMD